MITITEKKWNELSTKIEHEYGRSVILIRNRMKDTLGCTVRYGTYTEWPHRDVHLDFFDDVKETFFAMKYI